MGGARGIPHRYGKCGCALVMLETRTCWYDGVAGMRAVVAVWLCGYVAVLASVRLRATLALLNHPMIVISASSHYYRRQYAYPSAAFRFKHDSLTGLHYSRLSIGLGLAGGLQLEAMGAQYEVAALTGLRQNVALSVSCG
jgi:hypothetical protein